MQVPTTLDGLRKVLRSLGYGDVIAGLDGTDPDAKHHLMQEIAWKFEQSSQTMQDDARRKKALSYVERFPWSADMSDGMLGLHSSTSLATVLEAIDDVQALLEEEMILEPVEVEEYVDDDDDDEIESILIRRAARDVEAAFRLWPGKKRRTYRYFDKDIRVLDWADLSSDRAYNDQTRVVIVNVSDTSWYGPYTSPASATKSAMGIEQVGDNKKLKVPMKRLVLLREKDWPPAQASSSMNKMHRTAARAVKGAWAGSGFGGTLTAPNVTLQAGAAKNHPEPLHGWDRYVELVALAYEAAPKKTSKGKLSFIGLKQHILKIFKRIQSRVEVRFVDHDPYKTAAEMRDRVAKTGVLEVSSMFNQSEAFGPEVNLMLRAVHDFSAHLGSNPKKKPRPFSLKGELQSYNKHLNFIGKQSHASGALFTEIVGQVCFYWYNGDFPTQKIVTLPEFNWGRLGEVRGYEIVDGDLVPKR